MKRIQKALVEYAACTCVITLLFAGPALAQGTWQTLPDGDANQNSPGLHSPALNQIAQAGEMEVLNGPVSFHVRNHLAFGLLANIRRNWQQTLSEKGLVPTSDQKSFSVEFTVLKDGTLESRRVAESSGDTVLDSTGLDAIAKSAPFMAVPAEFTGQYLKLRCHFYLNPGRRIPPVSRLERSGDSTQAADNAPPAAAGGGSTIYGNGGPTKPRAIYSPEPEFSEHARKAKIQGTVVLKVVVDANGDVADVHVVHSVEDSLDQKAIEAVRTWKFKPGTEDGTPVKSEISVEVDFHFYNGPH
ncbi:MAG TPA: TonB family protein [Candidatus Sulfotelmatobacter sp.]|nr:TonB family protein [Candidatus Sulfotelmatobacter sp.]